MAERINGKAPFTRRTHGSERRGVFAAPNLNLVAQRNQSHNDKQRLIKALRERTRERLATKEKVDLGNKELPAYKHKQEILANVDAYKAVILGGKTGSGKSTQLPQYLYEAGYDMTIVTVPRRVIADGLVDRIREELSGQIPDFSADEVVGVAHGERSERHENNKILIVTPDSFNKMEKELRVSMADKKVAIIADEIHEANLFTEISTGVAAMSVRDLDNWRLIAASATHNPGSLQAAFGKINNGGYVPTIEIEGRPFDVTMEEDPSHTSMEVYALRGAEHNKSMIFTSGKREIDHIIEETMLELEMKEEGSSKQVVFRKLHAELSEFELGHIDDPIPEGHRLVIVSSPAGMSGITIPGVTMVITDGTINRQELDEDGVPGLVRHQLSKAEIIQQIGRAGRDVSGGIGIVSKPTTVIDDIMRSKGRAVEFPQMEYLNFGERQEHAPPEIYNSNLSGVVLSVAAGGRRFVDINEYIPHPVTSADIISAEESLSRLGALDFEDKATNVGMRMNEYPVSPELSRGLYEAKEVKTRTQQHLARAAFIAAAIDAGGLQDYSEPQLTEWKQLIRPTTTDDFIAQLDIILAFQAHERAGRPLHEFTEEFNLSPKRVERALKNGRKILKKFTIDPNNLILTIPVPDEEAELRNDFAAGMIDLVYEEVGKVNRKTAYRNIHGNGDSKRLKISGRSVTKPQRGQLVAGSPRWFLKHTKDGFVRHDVLELSMPVEPEIVGVYALINNLPQGKLIAPRIEGDRVVEREQKMFGSIPVGVPITSVRRELIPESSQSMLVQRALESPGDAQRALREIADELASYRERIPADVLAEYRKESAPEDLTKEAITELIVGYAQETRSLTELDQLLSQYVYSKNVTINRYYDEEARAALRERSPDRISINGVEARVHYDGTQPYVVQSDQIQKLSVKKKLYLPDGRQILLQIPHRSGKGTVRIKFGA